MCEAILFVCENVHRLMMDTVEIDLDCLYGFLMLVSRKKYSVLPRSLLWGLFHGFHPTFSPCIMQSLKHWGIPDALLSSEAACQWTLVLGSSVWDFLKLLTVSRSRLTSRLESLAERVGLIIQNAHVMDERVRHELHAADTSGGDPPLQQWYMSWALYLVTAFMDEYLSLLVELDILAVYELDCFYWYFDYILSCRLWAIRTIKELRFAVDVGMYEASQKEAQEVIKQSKKKKGKNGAARATAMSLKEAKKVLMNPPPTQPVANLEEFVITARSSIHKGLVRMYLSHAVTGGISLPSTTVCSMETIFSCRYRLFYLFANPPALRYSDYINSICRIPEYAPLHELTGPDTALQRHRGGMDLLIAAGRTLKQTKDMMDKAKIVHNNMLTEAELLKVASGGGSGRHAMDMRRDMLWEGASNLVRVCDISVAALSECCMYICMRTGQLVSLD